MTAIKDYLVGFDCGCSTTISVTVPPAHEDLRFCVIHREVRVRNVYEMPGSASEAPR